MGKPKSPPDFETIDWGVFWNSPSEINPEKAKKKLAARRRAKRRRLEKLSKAPSPFAALHFDFPSDDEKDKPSDV